ncbi:MAG: DNA-processing protein DprA [Phycisphaerales bacterium]|nr:DNA-processing protein DprA [Phycisphaerales bacterium]
MFQKPQDVSEGRLRAIAVSGLGPTWIARLIGNLGSLERIGHADRHQLEAAGMSCRRAHKIARALASVNTAQLRDQMERCDVGLVTIDDQCFPPLLRLIPDSPLALFGKGAFEALQLPSLAIVGSRRCSAEGTRAAQRFAGQLASWGLAVVSGGARGIDASAHRATLAVGGCTTVVLGCGHGHCYPTEHTELFSQIAQRGGVLVSEFLPDMGPRPGYFPRRNRIISGLALGVLVIEAGPRSGALVTARLAAEEHGREVMALPASLETPQAVGSLSLLARGEAQMVLVPQDVIAQLRFSANLMEAGSEASLQRSELLGSSDALVSPKYANDNALDSALIDHDIVERRVRGAK